MELRELKQGEEVMVIKPLTDTSSYQAGDIGVFKHMSGPHCVLDIKDNNECNACVVRENLLAIGDKITRGPDWRWGGEDGGAGNIGEVIEFVTPDGYDPEWTNNVRVKWSNGSTSCVRMTPDHQDLKPVGDSVDEGRPECFGTYVFNCSACTGCSHRLPNGDCRCIGGRCESKEQCKRIVKEPNKPKPIKENNTMANRSEEKRKLKETTIPQLEDAKAEAALALELAEAKLKRLEAHKTDHAETIADIMKAKKVTAEEAEAILRLSKGVGIQV